jgi:hypothetical protein
MTEQLQQAKFEGWAVVEMMGHQREIGYVTTEYYGAAAMFRVDAPAIAEREFELKRPDYAGGKYVPAGTKVKRLAIPAKTRLVAPGSLYAITPCTEETAMKAIEEMVPRALILLDIPADSSQPALVAGDQASAVEPYTDVEDEPQGWNGDGR